MAQRLHPTELPHWVEAAAVLPIAFAQVREDPLLDLWLVEQIAEGARVIMIASGGCTAALLAASPKVAHLQLVDANSAQLALTRLKLHLLQTTGTKDRLALLGHAAQPAAERADRLTAELQTLGLSTTTLGPLDFIAKVGPDQAGRYECVFAQLRESLSSCEDELVKLLQLSDPAEQARRVSPETDLGRALDLACDNVLALPNLVRLFGAEATKNPVQSFARHFACRTRHALATMPAAHNPYLWQMLLNRYPSGAMAPWLTAPVTAHLPALTWSQSFMTDALKTVPGEFDIVHLSNILDWLTPDTARATLEVAWKALRPGGWVLIRQLNSTLDIPALSNQFQWKAEQGNALHARDRSFFYRALHLGRKR